jgi:hypothetical protein
MANNLQRGTQEAFIAANDQYQFKVLVEGKSYAMTLRMIGRNTANDKQAVAVFTYAVTEGAGAQAQQTAFAQNNMNVNFNFDSGTDGELEIGIEPTDGEDTSWFIQYEFIQMPAMLPNPNP